MFIQTEETPNPQTLKFIPGVDVVTHGTFEAMTIADARPYPLAYTLMQVEGITALFFGRDFITLTKEESFRWESLKPELLTVIMEYFLTHGPIELEKESSHAFKGASEIELQIIDVIEEKVRPAVARDGGDIIFKNFDEVSGIVILELHGACRGCPSAAMTLKQGVENLLKYYVPEVQSVEEFVDA